MTSDDRRASAEPGELWASADACLESALSDEDFWRQTADRLGEPLLLFDRDSDLFGAVSPRLTYAVILPQLTRWQAAGNHLRRIEPRGKS